MKNMLNLTFNATAAGSIKASRIQPVSDVVWVDLMLDVGQITKGVFSDYRRMLIDYMYSQTYVIAESLSWTSTSRSSADMGVFFDEYAKVYSNIIDRVKASKELRIWFGSKADEVCSFRWFCNELLNVGFSGSLYMMNAPISKERNSVKSEITGWACFEPQEIPDYASLEEFITYSEMEKAAYEWKRLELENSNLRSIVNGSLISVDESYFDHALLELFPDGPVEMAYIVRDSLRGPLRFHSDLISAWRINKLIEAGKIEVLEDPEPRKRMKRILQRIS